MYGPLTAERKAHPMQLRLKRTQGWALLLSSLAFISFAEPPFLSAEAQTGRPAPQRPDVRRTPRRPPIPSPSPTPIPRGGPGIPAPREIHGIADLHAHLMSHEGFGRALFFGEPRGAHSRSLPHCDHGPGGLSLNPEAVHLVGGYPEFDGWPRFTTLVHQQAHVDWLRRAFDGGLRLVSMLAVNNELMTVSYLCPGGVSPRCRFDEVRPLLDDRGAIDRQVAAMRDLAARNSEWMEIATSSTDARRIIARGKLAIVLGIEVDSIGNWKRPEDLPTDLTEARLVIRRELQRLFDLGVRQITPIHLADNALGGSAIYNRFFDANNKYLTGRHHEVEEGWDTGIRYNLTEDLAENFNIVRSIAYMGGSESSAQWAGKRSHRNARGLTSYGIIFLEEMMRLGMIIDVDHMSEKALSQTLTMMERARYPVIASHTGFRELSYTADVPFSSRTHRDYGTSDIHKVAHEADKRAGTIERIRELGGMVAPILKQGDIKTWGRIVPNDSAGSSKSWAQAYLYAVDKMGGRGVALGSDINGLAGLPGPRFGTYAAHALFEDTRREDRRLSQANAQLAGVRYDSPIIDYRRYRFEGPGEIYGEDRTQTWEALAIYKSRTDPERAELPLIRGPWYNGKIKNLAKGFWAAETGARLEGRGSVLAGNTYAEQRVAFLVARGMEPTDDRSLDPPETLRLYPLVNEVWRMWTIMEGPSRTTPLTRSTAGRRDFDINLDGMAHYGMLPDFIQDLRNVGLTERHLAPLFRSAEHYIQMWATTERLSPPITEHRVTVTVHRVAQIDNLDTDSFISTDRADFYAQVTIDGHREQSRVVRERDDVSPEWSFSRAVSENTVTITIRLFDEDGGLSGPDDECDINSLSRRTELNLTYDLLPGRISGDASGVRGSRIIAIGNGDTNRARLWFTVDHR